MLHILFNSPFNCDYYLFLNTLKKKDNVLLIQNGVIAGLKNTLVNKKLIIKPIKIFALYNDVFARGIEKKIEKTIEIIKYSKFVELTISNYNQITW